jgi:hypothetical protein
MIFEKVLFFRIYREICVIKATSFKRTRGYFNQRRTKSGSSKTNHTARQNLAD